MSATAVERVVRFGCEGEDLVGILTAPVIPAGDVALLIIVGGPQYRAGSHRQFTRLARHVAGQGIAALRFDYRGMGDSGGSARNFEQVNDDIAAALDALQQQLPGLRGAVLCGLCDGAAAALLYVQARHDPRVAGLILQNPWVRSDQTQAAALVRHYYGRRLRSPEFWKKLLGGGIGAGAVKEWWRHRRAAKAADSGKSQVTPPFQERMALGWDNVDYPVLLQLSGEDLTAREFLLDWPQRRPHWATRPRLTRRDHPAADHTFSRTTHEQQMFGEVVAWWTQEISP